MTDIKNFDLIRIQEAYTKMLSEGFWNSKPAWTEEPTGFNYSEKESGKYGHGSDISDEEAAAYNKAAKNSAIASAIIAAPLITRTAAPAMGLGPKASAFLTSLSAIGPTSYLDYSAKIDAARENNAADTFLHDATIRAQREADMNGGKPSEIMKRDGVARKYINMKLKENGINDNIDNVVSMATNMPPNELKAYIGTIVDNKVDKKPLKATDRDIENPRIRDQVTLSRLIPTVGALTDVYNNYDALRRANPNNTIRNVVTSIDKSLPIYRWKVTQPQDKTTEENKYGYKNIVPETQNEIEADNKQTDAEPLIDADE